MLNKRIGSLIRTRRVFQDYLQHHPWKDNVLLDFLCESDLNVHLYHKGMFTAEKMKRLSVYLDMKNNTRSGAHQTYYETEPMIRFVELMAEKGCEVKIIIYLFRNFIKKRKHLKLSLGVAYDLVGGTRIASASEDKLHLELQYLRLGKECLLGCIKMPSPLDSPAEIVKSISQCPEDYISSVGSAQTAQVASGNQVPMVDCPVHLTPPGRRVKAMEDAESSICWASKLCVVDRFDGSGYGLLGVSGVGPHHRRVQGGLVILALN